MHQILGEDEWETILFSFNVAPASQEEALVSPPRKRRAIEGPGSPSREELTAGAAVPVSSPLGGMAGRRRRDAFSGGPSSEAGAARRSHYRGRIGAACRICRRC